MTDTPQPNYQLNIEDDRLCIKQIFNVSIDRLFACFTQPELLSRWHAPGELTTPHVEVDLKVGGTYKIAMKNADDETYTAFGEYKEIEKPDKGFGKLVYSWAWEHVEGSPVSTVTVLLKSLDDKTEVELIHEGFSTADVTQHHSQGWAGIFTNLDIYIKL